VRVFNAGLRNTVAVSLDLRNAKSATHFARMLNLPVAAANKQRLSDDKVVQESCLFPRCFELGTIVSLV